MGTIPAPNIVTAAQQISQNPLTEYARATQLGQEQQQFQQEEQQREMQTQMMRTQLQDQQTLRGLMPQFIQKDDSGKPTGFDWNGLMSAAQGKVMPQTLFALQKQQADLRQATATATKDEIANQKEINSELYQRAEGLKAITDPQERQTHYMQTLGWAQQHGVNVGAWPTAAPDNDHLTALESEFGMHAQALADYKTQAEGAAAEAAAGQRKAEAQAAKYKEVNGMLYDVSGPQPVPAIGQNITPDQWAALIHDVSAGNHALELRTQAQVGFYLKQGNLKAAQDAVTKAGEEQGSIEKETNPQVVATKTRLAYTEANARQQAAQGDPAVAGKMLADGSLTLADLKTRGTTPQFIEQATQAAQKINPQYNPADEMIAEHLAKSPQANQFFGSANSLIAKGGTLDQLAELGKKIPQHDFPVLNSIDDWQKLARGKGPLAAYAATALGVADDYGKVMGGGNASDHARDSALELFAKAASPEQRADAIAATRNAVQSQRDHRIGNNQFMKRAYQVDVGSGGMVKLKAPNGQIKEVPAEQADHYKQLGATEVQ